jgi:hypothetical protein
MGTRHIPQSMNQPYLEIYQEVRKRATQEKVIEYLSSLNFHFVNYSTISQYARGLHAWKDYQFMILTAGGKYNFNLVFVIKIMGTHVDHYFVCTESNKRTRYMRVECRWAVGQVINMRKKKILTKFPPSLDIQQRIDWRKIADKVLRGRAVPKWEYDWYEKFRPEVAALNPHIEHLKEGFLKPIIH